MCHPNAVCCCHHHLDPVHTTHSDWMGKYTGASRCCLKPKTTEHVAAILRHCHARHLAVVPQGGNTGLVGGSVPIADEIILSTSAMNIHAFDQVCVCVQLGSIIMIIIITLVLEYVFLYPINPQHHALPHVDKWGCCCPGRLCIAVNRRCYSRCGIHSPP